MSHIQILVFNYTAVSGKRPDCGDSWQKNEYYSRLSKHFYIIVMVKTIKLTAEWQEINNFYSLVLANGK